MRYVAPGHQRSLSLHLLGRVRQLTVPSWGYNRNFNILLVDHEVIVIGTTLHCLLYLNVGKTILKDIHIDSSSR